MGIKINSFGIEVPGKVIRTVEGDTTTITLDARQAQVVHEATGAVLEFVASQQELPLEETPPPKESKAAK